MYGRNDVNAEIGTSARDGANFYTLTYQPTTGTLDPQKFRKIAVSLDRPGLTATTRLGYFVVDSPERVNPANPSHQLVFDLASAADSTLVYDAVPLTLTQDPGDKDYFRLHIEAKGLVWSPGTNTAPRRANFVVATTTFDKKGNVLKQSAKATHVNAPATVAQSGVIQLPIGIPIKLDHDPRAVRVRFLIRVEETGARRLG